MKHTKHFPFRLALLLLASTALAQTGDGLASRTLAQGDEIATARSRYTQTADNLQGGNDGKPLAQLQRLGPRTPSLPQRGYPQRGSYQPRWIDHGHAGHAVIGAAIGFGLGALLGAKANTDQHPRATVGAVVIFGGIGALIGGAIGGSHGGHYAFSHRRKIHLAPQPEDEEADRGADSQGSHAKEIPAERSISARPASPTRNLDLSPLLLP